MVRLARGGNVFDGLGGTLFPSGYEKKTPKNRSAPPRSIVIESKIYFKNTAWLSNVSFGDNDFAMSAQNPFLKGTRNPHFPTTNWTLIRTIQHSTGPDAVAAMEEICSRYWYPIYVFHRRHGFAVADAEDLTQDFFRALVMRETIQAAREEKGRLRSFILNMLREMIAKHRRHHSALKRGGSVVMISFEAFQPEERYVGEPAEITDPAWLFDRAWAERLLAAATERLREDFAKADNLEDFEHLREYLPLGENATPYAEVARKSGIAEGALRLQIHRMRKRFAKHIEAEIAETVSDPEEQKAELAHLMAVMGR